MKYTSPFINRLLVILGLCLACSFVSSPCLAAPYELSVYSDDLPEKGETETELIFSFAQPRPDDDVPKGKISQTLAEISYGIAPGWAVGIELPGVHADGTSRLEGLKGEVQFVAPHEKNGWYWGVRCDIGYESSVYEAHGGNGTDINPIIGFRWSSWHFAANPSLEIPLGGESRQTVFMPAAKLTKSLDSANALGMEYFGNLGPMSNLLPQNKRDEMIYLVWDMKRDNTSINFGVGQPIHSSSGNADQWVVKAAFSFEMD